MVDYANVDPENFDLDFSLEGKNAIVTGGARGIGYTIAETFVKKGANVALFDMSDDVKDSAKEIGDNVYGFVTDVTDEDNVKKTVQAAKDELGQIDILVNAAGIANLAPAEEISAADFRQTIEVNLVGPFLVSQAVANVMIEQGKGGRIINIASQGAIIALDEHVAYNSSKEGLLGQTKVLAAEWAEFNINVNAISPTVILTAMGELGWSGEKGEKAKAGIPLKRFGYPEEVAAIAVFLAADATSLITGENIVIDGGNTIV